MEKTLENYFLFIRNGVSIKQFDGDGIPITRIESISNEYLNFSKLGFANIYDENYKEYYLKNGDILMSHINSQKHLGKTAIIENLDKKVIHGMNLICLRPDMKKILPEYIFYFFKTKKFKKSIVKISKKSVNQASFSVGDLKKIKIEIPTLIYQEEVVKKLNKVKKILNDKKEQIKLLDELIKSRFIEMFGDPIRNEKGWEIDEWKNLFKTQTGKLDSNAMVEGGKYPFFTCAKEIFYIDEYLFDCEALILAGNNAAGIYDVKYYNGKFNAYQRTYVINLINKEYSYIFFKFLLESKLKYLKDASKGSSTRYLTMSILNNLRFILPPLSLQNTFTEFVTSIDKLKFLYNFIWYIFIDLLKKLTIEVLFFLTFLTFSANIRLDIELAEREEKMKYYRRSIEQVINEYKEQFPILLLTGPRQVGKSTLFKELFREEYKYFSLDDPILKEQLISDPRLFLKNNPEKLIIDEVQYAPSIFPYLKMKVDENREDGMYLMTGSQAFVLMKNVSETLAGRVGILELQGISLREQFDIEFNKPFIPNEEYISEREKNITEYTDLWQRIHRGYMPELVFNDKKKWEFFYSSYVQTYIERDVRDLINISDESKFLKFMISLASRSGELLNYGAVANEVGVSNETVKRWVSVLRTSRIIYLMEPYFNNHLKRVIKTPKIYFMDVGLLAYLTKWPTPETLANGAKAGNIFETFVVSEIIKSYLNAGIINPPIYFYRDKDKKEIDLIIEEAEKIYPIEIKMSASPDKEMAKNFSVLKGKIDKEIGTGIIICQYDNKVYLSEDILVLPIEYI